MSQYRIHPIVMGTKVFDKGMMTYQYDYKTPYTIPIYCWYLEGGDKNILVDTGEMHPICSSDREQAIGGKIYGFEEGLARWDLTPEKIDIVLHTHLHNDHCENDYKCGNATFYVHQRELDHIHSPHPLDYRYLEDYIEDTLAAGQITALTEDTDIVSGIRMMHTPAHTEGGMSIVVDTPGGTAVITGLCCLLENFFPPIQVTAMEMEVIPPGTHVNVNEAYDILLQVREMADILLPLHEPQFASQPTIGDAAPSGR